MVSSAWTPLSFVLHTDHQTNIELKVFSSSSLLMPWLRMDIQYCFFGEPGLQTSVQKEDNWSHIPLTDGYLKRVLFHDTCIQSLLFCLQFCSLWIRNLLKSQLLIYWRLSVQCLWSYRSISMGNEDYSKIIWLRFIFLDQFCSRKCISSISIMAFQNITPNCIVH